MTRQLGQEAWRRLVRMGNVGMPPPTDGTFPGCKFQCRVEEPKSSANASLIFLHGLGDNGPRMNVTLNGGMRMPSWFDIYALSIEAPQDESGIIAASNELTKMVNHQIDQGIPPNRIILGGFSQGGAVAVYNALTTGIPYGGLILLSSWLPLHKKFQANPSLAKAPKTLRYFLGHGDMDCVVPYEMGQLTYQFLQKMGFTDGTFTTYPKMNHESCEKELSDVKNFITKISPAGNSTENAKRQEISSSYRSSSSN